MAPKPPCRFSEGGTISLQQSHDEMQRGSYLHEAAVAVAGAAGGDALGDDAAARVFAHMDHLGAGVCLLVVVGQGHAVKLAHTVVSLEHHARILPRNRAPRLHLQIDVEQQHQLRHLQGPASECSAVQC